MSITVPYEGHCVSGMMTPMGEIYIVDVGMNHGQAEHHCEKDMNGALLPITHVRIMETALTMIKNCIKNHEPLLRIYKSYFIGLQTSAGIGTFTNGITFNYSIHGKLFSVPPNPNEFCEYCVLDGPSRGMQTVSCDGQKLRASLCWLPVGEERPWSVTKCIIFFVMPLLLFSLFLYLWHLQHYITVFKTERDARRQILYNYFELITNEELEDPHNIVKSVEKQREAEMVEKEATPPGLYRKRSFLEDEDFQHDHMRPLFANTLGKEKGHK